MVEQVGNVRALQLTRSCSFEHEEEIEKQMERAVIHLLSKVEDNMGALEKDLGIYLLMLLQYSNMLSV